MNERAQMHTKTDTSSFSPSPPLSAGTGLLQRKCACEGTPGVDGECEQCRKRRLQGGTASHAKPENVPSIVHETLSSPGQPLDEDTRAFMESRFGHNFAHVRVHADAQAAESARAVNALAYTVGQHIAFGAGQYVPERTEGKQVIAHELTHVVQQDRAVTGPARIGRADDHFERQAERAAGSVVGEVPIGTVTKAPEPIVSRIGGLGYAPDPRDELLRTQYREFIDNAARYGMPTRFLRAITSHYSILKGGGNFVNSVLDFMVLQEQTMQSVANMSPLLPFGESSAIQTIYHESTHAYLDLTSDEEKTAEAIKAGVAHYKDAPLTGGSRGDDPERLFQEAAASYVGHRVATWWNAFESLSIAAAGEIPSDKIADWVADTRQKYDAAMAEREFGYQESGGFLGFGTRQTETTRPISPPLRNFLDATILEGKMPDKFDAVAGFQELIARAMERRSSQGESIPPTQGQPTSPGPQR